MSAGVLIYRCKLCGAVDSTVRAMNAEAFIAEAVTQVQAELVSVHRCANGALGVSELIGGKPDPKEEEKPT